MPMSEPVRTERIYEGRVLHVRVDTLDVGEGRTVKREVIEHNGAVVVAALDDRGRVLLVRQYRHAAGESLLELPAGTLERGEEPLATAIREMQEETGCYPTTIEQVGSFFSAPGFCTELLHFFVAHDLRNSPLHGDEDEQIEVVPTDLADIPGLALSGRIRDAKTLAGLYLLHLRGS